MTVPYSLVSVAVTLTGQRQMKAMKARKRREREEAMVADCRRDGRRERDMVVELKKLKVALGFIFCKVYVSQATWKSRTATVTDRNSDLTGLRGISLIAQLTVTRDSTLASVQAIVVYL